MTKTGALSRKGPRGCGQEAAYLGEVGLGLAGTPLRGRAACPTIPSSLGPSGGAEPLAPLAWKYCAWQVASMPPQVPPPDYMAWASSAVIPHSCRPEEDASSGLCPGLRSGQGGQ